MTDLSILDTLPTHIATLIEERASHVAAIAAIDGTLAGVSAALGESPSIPMAMPVRAPAAKAARAPKAAAAKAQTKPGRPPASQSTAKPAGTANEFVLAMIKEKKNPTSQEINAAWKASGRNRTADITLSLLTKAKKLTRTPLGEGIRGSRYSLA